MPSSAPIIRNGETWIYYFGYRHAHNAWSQFQYLKDHDHDVRDHSSYLLAKMSEDQWVSLEARNAEGWFLARPYAPPSRLLVNADARGGSIEAEFFTPYGGPVEGFTHADCLGISGNGKDQRIRWKTGVDPRSLVEKHRGRLGVKFHLTNAKLYSYSLVEPDADGTINRYWDNARWNEAILYRSGNWDGNSSKPAGGVPQPPGTQNPSGTRCGPNPRAEAK